MSAYAFKTENLSRHFAGFKAVHDHAPDFYGAASGGYAEKRATMSAGPFETGQHFFALGNLFFHFPMHVREGGTHAKEDGF